MADIEERGVVAAPPGAVPQAGPARLQRNARLALVAALILLGAWTVHSFLPAVAWAAILAVAVWPVYDKARRRWPPAGHAVLLPVLFTVGVAVVFGLPFILLGVQAGREAHQLLLQFREATTSGIAVPDSLEHLPFGGEFLSGWWRENLSDPVALSGVLNHLDQGSMVVFTRKLGVEVAHRAMIFFFMLLAFFFFLREADSLVRNLLHASAKLFGTRGERIARQMVASIHGTVDGLVLVGLAEGVIMGIVYVIAGVPHPMLLGAVTGVAAIIPFAVFIVFAIVGLLLLAKGTVAAAIAVVAFGTVIVLLADHLVRPVLIGGATRLPFLWVLFGILGGVETWGIVGLFIGPALMAALILLWREFTEDRVGVPVDAMGPAAARDVGAVPVFALGKAP